MNLIAFSHSRNCVITQYAALSGAMYYGVTYNFTEMPTIPIFKANFRITNSNVKITAHNHFKMVPNKITGVTPTSTPVIPDHR